MNLGFLDRERYRHRQAKLVTPAMRAQSRPGSVTSLACGDQREARGATGIEAKPAKRATDPTT